ncbi:hypothetical protein DLM78_05495 [Leptospira stimsonii]|uniref:Uncharacterized protein n=1 Tax=Leptospira stimsonii TaxID=2202203 RepID=A0A8B3CVZ7_9LEPT|nr:hypothetical protein DLM78_05495 [Leptospira stimsonii]
MESPDFLSQIFKSWSSYFSFRRLVIRIVRKGFGRFHLETVVSHLVFSKQGIFSSSKIWIYAPIRILCPIYGYFFEERIVPILKFAGTPREKQKPFESQKTRSGIENIIPLLYPDFGVRRSRRVSSQKK